MPFTLTIPGEGVWGGSYFQQFEEKFLITLKEPFTLNISWMKIALSRGGMEKSLSTSTTTPPPFPPPKPQCGGQYSLIDQDTQWFIPVVGIRAKNHLYLVHDAN